MLAPPRHAAQRVATGRLDRAMSPHSLKPDQAAKLCVPLANKYGVPAPNRQFVDIVKARISNHTLPLAARSKVMRYFREELLIVLGTSSSEPVLPRILQKLETLGCKKGVSGLVLPMGYSFNLDGTAIYLTLASLFIAQACDIHLSFGQIAAMLGIMLLTSKGA